MDLVAVGVVSIVAVSNVAVSKKSSSIGCYRPEFGANLNKMGGIPVLRGRRANRQSLPIIRDC